MPKWAIIGLYVRLGVNSVRVSVSVHPLGSELSPEVGKLLHTRNGESEPNTDNSITGGRVKESIGSWDPMDTDSVVCVCVVNQARKWFRQTCRQNTVHKGPADDRQLRSSFCLLVSRKEGRMISTSYRPRGLVPTSDQSSTWKNMF